MAAVEYCNRAASKSSLPNDVMSRPESSVDNDEERSNSGFGAVRVDHLFEEEGPETGG